MARKPKSVYDQLRSENVALRNDNIDLVTVILKMRSLNRAIAEVTIDRTTWLVETIREIRWYVTHDFDPTFEVIEPKFRFIDQVDETLYKIQYPNSILNEALGRLP